MQIFLYIILILLIISTILFIKNDVMSDGGWAVTISLSAVFITCSFLTTSSTELSKIQPERISSMGSPLFADEENYYSYQNFTTRELILIKEDSCTHFIKYKKLNFWGKHVDTKYKVNRELCK